MKRTVFIENLRTADEPTQSGTVIFHYDLQGKIMAESTSAGTIQAEYAFLNNSPLAKLEGASVYYYHNDHLGTPIGRLKKKAGEDENRRNENRPHFPF